MITIISLFIIKTKVAFLEGRLLSSQSELSEKFSKSPDWLEKKTALQKSHFCFDHINRIYSYIIWHASICATYLKQKTVLICTNLSV